METNYRDEMSKGGGRRFFYESVSLKDIDLGK
jgi:hypothetical protein